MPDSVDGYRNLANPMYWTLAISDGGGDAQILVSQLAGAGTGQAEATYNTQTGELRFNVGAGVGVIGIEVRGNRAITEAAVEPFFSTTAAQNDGKVLAFFDVSGLPVGEDSVGLCLPLGLTDADIGFKFTPIGGASTAGTVRLISGPSDPQLEVSFQEGNVVITWAAGRLVSSPTVAGIYAPVEGATSPELTYGALKIRPAGPAHSTACTWWPRIRWRPAPGRSRPGRRSGMSMTRTSRSRRPEARPIRCRLG